VFYLHLALTVKPQLLTVCNSSLPDDVFGSNEDQDVEAKSKKRSHPKSPEQNMRKLVKSISEQSHASLAHHAAAELECIYKTIKMVREDLANPNLGVDKRKELQEDLEKLIMKRRVLMDKVG
jgi:hypothetical protein